MWWMGSRRSRESAPVTWKYPKVEAALLDWLDNARAASLPVNGPVSGATMKMKRCWTKNLGEYWLQWRLQASFIYFKTKWSAAAAIMARSYLWWHCEVHFYCPARTFGKLGWLLFLSLNKKCRKVSYHQGLFAWMFVLRFLQFNSCISKFAVAVLRALPFIELPLILNVFAIPLTSLKWGFTVYWA